MTQTSGPISSGTLVERQFTDTMWRDLFGDEPGVVGDLDGSAYAYTLSLNSDVMSIGSSTQDSKSVVGGFSHKIPAGAPEPITIPAASGADRTDLIVVRYDPANIGAPGPCRLARIAGTSVALPAYDASPPGVEDLPLWYVTRRPGQALSQATVRRAFTRLARILDVPPSVPLPPSAPLGYEARHGDQQYRRELGAASTPVWRQSGPTSRNGPLTPIGGWADHAGGYPPPGYRLTSERVVHLQGLVRRTGPTFTFTTLAYQFATMPPEIVPPTNRAPTTYAGQGANKVAVRILITGGSNALTFQATDSPGTMESGAGHISLDGISWYL